MLLGHVYKRPCKHGLCVSMRVLFAVNQFRCQYPQRYRQHRHAAHAATWPRGVGVQEPKQHCIREPNQANTAQGNPTVVVHATKTAAKPKQMPQLGIHLPSTGQSFSDD